MGTQVLPAQDFLIHQNPIVFHRRQKPYTVNGTTDPRRQTNNNPHWKSNAWRHLQKRSTVSAMINRSPSTPELTAKHQKKKQRMPVVMTLNKVKSMNNIENISGSSGSLLNSPAIHDDWYAGSTFVESPSPGCLPMPSFFNRKQGLGAIDDGFDDIATKDLRHLLRLA